VLVRNRNTSVTSFINIFQVGPGDDVIIPTFTMIAVANAVHFVQARPIFADSCQQNR
jgi:dTDP-4-amino-4,6-dideoxygalactose transaminase